MAIFDHNVAGVIFDLDQTLLSSCLNFTAIKDDIGCPENEDILDFIEGLPLEQRKSAQTIVLKHELEDARTCNWMPGAKSLVEYLMDLEIPLAIVTRNSAKATSIKIETNKVPIDLVITREDAPAKPDPTALLNISEQWQLPPAKLAYIGDYIYDVQAAHNAKMLAFQFSAQSNKECKDHYLSHLTYVPNPN